jgi:molybdopterin-guanine dinucleotide biosynthesis protein A
MVARVKAALGGLADETVLVVAAGHEDDYRDFGQRVLVDQEAFEGPLAAVVRAMELAAGVDGICLVAGGDMPFVSTTVAEQLLGILALYRTAVAAVPSVGDQIEPLLGAYRRDLLLEAARPYVAEGGRSFQGLLKRSHKLVVPLRPEDELAVFNVNTPEDLAAAEEIARLRG